MIQDSHNVIPVGMAVLLHVLVFGSLLVVIDWQRREQTIVPLDEPVPVHLDYRTAFTEPKARTQFRRDIYGRDARIWKALENAGVALRAVRS